MLQLTNAMTMKVYKGRNVQTLSRFMSEQGFTDTRFATMKQWNAMNRCIIAGSKSCGIGFVDADNERAFDSRRGYVFKTYRVFNIEQTRPYTEEERKKYESRLETNRIGVTL
jgi:antirestriction protein ArdC